MKKSAIWLSLGAAIPIFVIVAWMMLDSACGQISDIALLNACRYGWVGALSGWAAAIGALTAAVWAYNGLRNQMTLQALQHRADVLEKKLLHATQQCQGTSKAIKSFDYLAARAELANNSNSQNSLRDFCRDITSEAVIARLKESVSLVRNEHSATVKLALRTAESLFASAGQMKSKEFRTECIGLKTLRDILTQHARSLHAEISGIKIELHNINQRICQYEDN